MIKWVSNVIMDLQFITDGIDIAFSDQILEFNVFVVPPRLLRLEIGLIFPNHPLICVPSIYNLYLVFIDSTLMNS